MIFPNTTNALPSIRPGEFSRELPVTWALLPVTWDFVTGEEIGRTLKMVSS